MTGSYERKEWKATLRHLLLHECAGATAAEAGPFSMDIAITTGRGRNWAKIWKPLIEPSVRS
jgi:hypothetical protein